MIFFQPVRRFIVPLVVVMLSSLTVGCSMGTMVVKGSLAIIDSGALAMNRETDLQGQCDASAVWLCLRLC